MPTQNPLHAEFYKCISANGDTTYNDAPCQADQSIHVLTKYARELPVLDCRVARNFAFDIVARMRQGDSAQAVFSAYGGAESLTEDALGLINNVYSFSTSRNQSVQKIVELTVERCQSGVLGKKLDQCGAYPEQFIERSGGCTEARQVEATTFGEPEAAEAMPVVTEPLQTPDVTPVDTTEDTTELVPESTIDAMNAAIRAENNGDNDSNLDISISDDINDDVDDIMTDETSGSNSDAELFLPLD